MLFPFAVSSASFCSRHVAAPCLRNIKAERECCAAFTVVCLVHANDDILAVLGLLYCFNDDVFFVARNKAVALHSERRPARRARQLRAGS